jgi:hypothetical protein
MNEMTHPHWSIDIITLIISLIISVGQNAYFVIANIVPIIFISRQYTTFEFDIISMGHHLFKGLGIVTRNLKKYSI